MTIFTDPIPVVITDRAVNLRTRRRRTEVWGARSRDGEWTFQRTEDTGTPWYVVHEPTGFWTMFTSLPRARNYARLELGLRLSVGMIEVTRAAFAHGAVWFSMPVGSHG